MEQNKTIFDKEMRISDISGIKVEIRKAEENDTEEMILEGYPIVFGQKTLIGNAERGFYEIIDKSAFNNCDMSDVCLRYNHLNGFLILARTRNKSLELSVDEHGVFMRAKLIPTTTNKDVYLMAKSELLSQGSFSFVPRAQKVDRSGTIPVRTLTDIRKLLDVSVVDTPAYDGTNIYARSLELADAWEDTADTEQGEKRVKNYAITNLIKQYKGAKN